MKIKKIFGSCALLLLMAGCSSMREDPNALLSKARVVAYATGFDIPSKVSATPIDPSDAKNNLTSTPPIVTIVQQQRYVRLKADTGQEFPLWTRDLPPKGLRLGDCVNIYLSNRPGYPRLAGRTKDCAFNYKGEKAVDLNDEAKSFAKNQQYANVYIYRNELFGWGPMAVTLDGAPIGSPITYYYFFEQLKPGRHTIAAQANGRNEMEIDVEAGRNYFIWLEAKVTFSGIDPFLHLVDEAVGQEDLSNPEILLFRSATDNAQ